MYLTLRTSPTHLRDPLLKLGGGLVLLGVDRISPSGLTTPHLEHMIDQECERGSAIPYGSVLKILKR